MASVIKTPKSLPPNASLNVDQQKEFNQKVQELKKKGATGDAAVVYIGHVPHGFFEDQMRAYFSQFGHVKQLRISRSKKSGRSKGYAFVEFESNVVARIVADTMNNYLMFNRLLKCQLIPADKVHESTFKGSKNPFSQPKSHILSIERHNSVKSLAKQKTSVRRFKTKTAKTLTKLSKMGIEYDFQGVNEKTVNQVVNEKTVNRVKKLTTPVLPTIIRKSEVKEGLSTEQYVINEDSSEDEVTFRTPPNTVKVKRTKKFTNVKKGKGSKKLKCTK